MGTGKDPLDERGGGLLHRCGRGDAAFVILEPGLFEQPSQPGNQNQQTSHLATKPASKPAGERGRMAPIQRWDGTGGGWQKGGGLA